MTVWLPDNPLSGERAWGLSLFNDRLSCLPGDEQIDQRRATLKDFTTRH
jgi:hypothetical protein